jgi:hypothetical protein
MKGLNTMQLTPSIKGQLTKARKNATQYGGIMMQQYRDNVFAVFARIMSREQAKQATRKYLAGPGVVNCHKISNKKEGGK